MKLLSVLSLSLVLSCTTLSAQKVYEISAFGLKANSSKNASPVLQKALAKIKAEYKEGEKVILRFPEGRYEFHEKGAAVREYYISNHDQTNPKKVGIALEDMKNLTLDGQGSEFVFHGRMLPVSLLRSENCLLKNFSIDFENPHIAQVKIVENDPQDGIVFEPAPWVDYRIAKDSIFEAYGEGWTMRHSWGIAFDGDTKHLVYNTSDIGCPTKGASEVAPRRIHAPGWKDARLVPGTVVAMRGWGRPTPGIFLSHDVNTTIENVKVHYAEGMGLLAQLCENITLEKFGVCLKGDADPRYFTTQADATHFSGCKGKIVSCNGLYEGMMDDAINVHGTYLKVVKRVDDRTLVGRYMHGQSWGFEWGCPGDEVQFIRSNTMELVGKQNKIISIRPYDKEQTEGAREFLITFQEPVDQVINEQSGFGIENLTWTPEVLFSGNVIRNNRDRKLDALEDLIESANGKPLLVVYWFKHDRERILKRFPARDINTKKDIEDWNEGKIPVALIHPASAGHGLNLQEWFSLTWSLELYQQLNARLYRQGQKHTVIIEHLVTEGTVDEDILRAIEKKDTTQNAMIEAVKARIGGMTDDGRSNDEGI